MNYSIACSTLCRGRSHLACLKKKKKKKPKCTTFHPKLLHLPRQSTEEVSRDVAEENGEQLYEEEPKNQSQYAQQEDLYQAPEETAAGGDIPVLFISLLTLTPRLFREMSKCLAFMLHKV